ncbi:MAG: hypothetical protein P1Q69_09935 [Candidatus Thorarchaeota archaeon]|nr:hypothetical protein [Candidatus Thorarchaeota archaeon]
MKQYDTGMSTALTSAIVIAVIVVGGVFAATMFFPGTIIPTTTTTPTTPTTPGTSYGIRAAYYLESRRDDVAFYWIFNCSFVNNDLSAFYDDTQSGAFVDGVKMAGTEEGATVEVLFSPRTANIVGTGELSPSVWENLGGSIVNTIENLPDSSYQELTDWYPTFNIGIYFTDGTFFALQYYSTDQMVDLTNGTWDGVTAQGWPLNTGYDPTSHWLYAAGLLDAPITSFYTAITENVLYP